MTPSGTNDFARQQAVRSRHLVRIVHPITGSFLHLSGNGWVKKADWAWSGTKAQGRVLMERQPLLSVCEFEYVHSDSSVMSLKKAIEA